MAKWNNADAGKFSSRLSEGEAEFVVVKAEDQVSKKGNPMTKLTLQVDQGVVQETVWHYILDGDANGFKHFLEATNRPDLLAKQDVPADLFRGLEGKIMIEIEADLEGNNKKAKIKSWVKAWVGQEAYAEEKGKLDDKMPF